MERTIADSKNWTEMPLIIQVERNGENVLDLRLGVKYVGSTHFSDPFINAIVLNVLSHSLEHVSHFIFNGHKIHDLNSFFSPSKLSFHVIKRSTLLAK